MVNPTGYTALDLIGFTDKGTYAANVSYVKNDLVHYGGSIWRILIDDTIGITPAEGPNYTLYIGEPTNLVERIIAPLEDNPATVAYTTGRQIIYNDYLYEVIQDIAIGDVLIAYEDDPTNANIKRSSPVETQVLALNGRMDTAEDDIDDLQSDVSELQSGKADNSVIAPVESGTTASRAYAAGAHFIKNGSFCTAKTAIAQGETFMLNTNYTVGNIGDRIEDLEEKKSGQLILPSNKYSAVGANYVNMRNKILQIGLNAVISSTISGSNDLIGTLPEAFRWSVGNRQIFLYGKYTTTSAATGFFNLKVTPNGEIRTEIGSGNLSGTITINAIIFL